LPGRCLADGFQFRVLGGFQHLNPFFPRFTVQRGEAIDSIARGESRSVPVRKLGKGSLLVI